MTSTSNERRSEVRPVHPGRGGVERAAEQPIPVAHREDVRRERDDVAGADRHLGRELHHCGAAAGGRRRPRLHRPLGGRQRGFALLLLRARSDDVLGILARHVTSTIARGSPLARLGDDVLAPGAARSEHPRVAYEGVTWWRQNRREPGHELEPRHDPVLPSAPGHVLQAIGHSSARQSAEPLEGQRRTCPISRQPLAPHVVAGFDARARVKVEAGSVDSHGRFVGGRLMVRLGLGCINVGQRCHLPASHGDGGARIEGRPDQGLV